MLNNAAKFTDTGGHVWVDVRAEQGSVTITVRDDGVGIAPAQLDRAFEMFVQLDASAERLKGGLGLGLPLVQTLVELHGERFMRVALDSATAPASPSFSPRCRPQADVQRVEAKDMV